MAEPRAFKKHGGYIKQHGLELVGKRIFVRIRPETDNGPNLYEQVKALVPGPEAQMDKKGRSSSKDHRRIIERPSKDLRSTALTTRPQHATGQWCQPANA